MSGQSAVEEKAVNPEAPLVLRLFGPFDAQVNGRPLPPLRSRRGQWLLALLILRHGREVERGWLAGTLWPDNPESQALYNLRRNLVSLRHALGVEAGRLRAPTPHTLSLDLQGAEADVAAFDAAITQGDAPSLRRAVALYRGPLLEGCGEEWAFPERQAREGAYLSALEQLADRALTDRDVPAAEGYLRQAAAVDPLRESAQRALMQALAVGGNDAAALLTYRELRLRLHRELNAEPDPETTVLFQQIRAEARRRAASPASGVGCEAPGDRGRGSGAAPAPSLRMPGAAWVRPARFTSPVAGDPLHEAIPHNLPLQLTRFVGREDQIAEVMDWLTTHRLVTLTGIGGCGKTRLALQVATHLLAEFADGVWFIELAPLADPALAPQSVAAALGIQETPGRSLSQTLADALRGRQLLLLLDNCEHLVTACAHLAEALLQSCPRLQILATSREPLRVAGEAPYCVPSLSLPDHNLSLGGQGGVPPEVVAGWCQYEAMRLFIERAATALPPFRVTQENAWAVVRICQQLDGIPLAIELAAARVKVLPVEQIAARLDDRFRLLVGGSRTALPRHQTLRALFDWSYNLLTKAEQALLQRLSVFAGGWNLEAAEAVCADPVASSQSPVVSGDEGLPSLTTDYCLLPTDDVLGLLTQLVEKSLVVYEERPGEGRYRLLETVRQYGRDRLLEAGEAAVVRGRHLEFFLWLAEEARLQLVGPEQGRWLARLDADHDNLRAALAWSREAEAQREAGLRLAIALWPFWDAHAHLSEARECLTALLEQSGGASPTLRARALVQSGHFAEKQGHKQSARLLAEESLAIFRGLEDKEGIAGALSVLGSIAQGDAARARSLLAESLSLYRELRDKGELREEEQIAWVLISTGHTSLRAGDRSSARSLYEESLAAFRESDHKLGIATSLFALGNLASFREEYALARSLFAECLQIGEELGSGHIVARSLFSLGDLARWQGDYEGARSRYEQSLAITRGSDHKYIIAGSLVNLGLAFVRLGEHEEARSCVRESLVIWQEVGDRDHVVRALECLAQVAFAQGQPDRMARLLGVAEAQRVTLHDPLPPGERANYDCVAPARAALGEEAFAAAWAAGRSMPLERVIAEALTV